MSTTTSSTTPDVSATPAGHVDCGTVGPNTFVEGIYSLYNPQLGATRSGKPYFKCLLRDATGEIAARQWSFDERLFDDVARTGFVWITGHTQLYNAQMQLVLEQIKAIEVGDEELRYLLPVSRYDLDAMFDEVKTLLGSLEHPAIRALADAYLDDEDLMAKFTRAPAAMSVHHAWIGGLLEHTLQLMRFADRILPLYPELNRDLVLTGLFLHDLAKTVELTWERGFNYSTEGNLVGHVVQGAIWLQVKAAVAAKRSGHRLPGDTLKVLQHILISHHGQLEHGAVKMPATPEAIFVSQLDDLDAKTQLALSAAGRGDGSGAVFTEKVWALGTRVYRPDPLKE